MVFLLDVDVVLLKGHAVVSKKVLSADWPSYSGFSSLRSEVFLSIAHAHLFEVVHMSCVASIGEDCPRVNLGLKLTFLFILIPQCGSLLLHHRVRLGLNVLLD